MVEKLTGSFLCCVRDFNVVSPPIVGFGESQITLEIKPFGLAHECAQADAVLRLLWHCSKRAVIEVECRDGVPISEVRILEMVVVDPAGGIVDDGMAISQASSNQILSSE